MVQQKSIYPIVSRSGVEIPTVTQISVARSQGNAPWMGGAISTLPGWEGHTLFPMSVNHGDTNQSLVSVSSTLRKTVDSALLRVCYDALWFHVSRRKLI